MFVACAADDRFAMPLAVMARSAAENLDPGRRLHLFVLDGGIREKSRRRLLASWAGQRLDVEWVALDRSRLAEMKVTGHVAVATYFRLLLPELLPASLSRVLYLDADVVVESDLGPLWDTDLRELALAAAQDLIVGHVSAPNGLRNWRELGLGEGAKYFNAGVLLLDLDRWRSERLGERVLDYLRRHRDVVRWWDQDGLNAVLAGRWLELDPRWNLTIQSETLPSVPPCDAATFREAIARPYVTHFLTHVKPWHTTCRHPRRDVFFRYLDETAWRGWRPRRNLLRGFRLHRRSRPPAKADGEPG
ncbi:MAG: hypothetical protein QOD06_3244 [Candidatus Binatota bacterium]|nr:hypothetical protein [Candidatus Binatota bacterium]